jgi:hypothetical protein
MTQRDPSSATLPGVTHKAGGDPVGRRRTWQAHLREGVWRWIIVGVQAPMSSLMVWRRERHRM